MLSPPSSLTAPEPVSAMTRAAVRKACWEVFLVGAERHVDDQQWPLEAAAHGLAVHDHHVERHIERRRQAVKHHADTVADQNDVAVRIDQPCNGRRICHQADKRHLALPRRNVRGVRALVLPVSLMTLPLR
jgi:hypothetical protein